MPRLRPWMIATALCLLYIAAVIIHNRGDAKALVTIGTRFSQSDSNGTEGYDGQFVYYIARDPGTAAAYLDVPAYRFQRILLPVLGRLLSLGQESLIPWALLLVNSSALAGGTYLLERLLEARGVNRWYAFTYGLTLGIFGAVRLSLPEPLAYGLVILGIWLADKDKWLWSAVVFALAALTKETTLLFVAGYGLFLLLERHWRTVLSFGIMAVSPFALWQLILFRQFAELGIGSGGALATRFEIIPFAGALRILTDTPPEARAALLLIFGSILIPFVIVPTLWALWRCWLDFRQNRWTALTCLLFINAAVMLFVPFSTYREPIGILRFIVGLQIALILYAAERHQKRALRNSTIWILTALFAFTLF